MPLENDQARPVGLWLVPAESANLAAMRKLTAILSPWEQRRVNRLRLEADKSRYIAAHALVRLALSETHPAPPEQWQLDQSPSGKPFVSGPSDGRGIEFSLSHTRGLVGCAVAQTPVGLDLEILDRHLDVDGLLPHVMATQELERWNERACKDKTRRFLSYWTLKEASAKALGIGMRMPFPNLAFDVDDGDQATIMALPGAFGDASRWKVRLLDWAGTHVGAIAVRSEPDAAIEFRIRRLELEALARAIA